MVRSIRHWCLAAGVLEESPRHAAAERLLPAQPSARRFSPTTGSTPTSKTRRRSGCCTGRSPPTAPGTTWFWTFSHFHEPEFTREALTSGPAPVDADRSAASGWPPARWSATSSASCAPTSPSRQTKRGAEDTLDCPLVELGLIRATADRQAFHFNRGSQPAPARRHPAFTPSSTSGTASPAACGRWPCATSPGSRAAPDRCSRSTRTPWRAVRCPGRWTNEPAELRRDGRPPSALPAPGRRYALAAEGAYKPAAGGERGRRWPAQDLEQVVTVSPPVPRSVASRAQLDRPGALNGYVLTPDRPGHLPGGQAGTAREGPLSVRAGKGLRNLFRPEKASEALSRHNAKVLVVCQASLEGRGARRTLPKWQAAAHQLVADRPLALSCGEPLQQSGKRTMPTRGCRSSQKADPVLLDRGECL